VGLFVLGGWADELGAPTWVRIKWMHRNLASGTINFPLFIHPHPSTISHSLYPFLTNVPTH
jgi:hypothetical protein